MSATPPPGPVRGRLKAPPGDAVVRRVVVVLLPEAGAIYVVDRGYVDFPRLPVWHQAGPFFVTRAKSNMDAQRNYSAPADRSAGIICGRTISLDGFDTHQGYPELLRRIRTKVPETGKTPVFIPNNFALPAATIKKRLDLDASIYALLQILSVTLFEKMTMHQALGGDENK